MAPDLVRCTSSAGAGQAEVEDLDPAAVRWFQPEVGGLDVAVDQAAFVGGGQPRGRSRRPMRRRPATGISRVLPEQVLEAYPLEQRHGQKRHAAVLADLVMATMWSWSTAAAAWASRRKRRAPRLAGRFRPHHLEGDLPLELHVLRLEDHVPCRRRRAI